MKKLNRMVSSIVLAAFIFNSTVSDLALAQPMADKLAVPSMCDDLVGIQHKDMGQIQIALEAELKLKDKTTPGGLPKEFDALKAVMSGADKTNARTIFSPAEIQPFFHEMNLTPKGPCVMYRIFDPSTSATRTYYAIFSQARDAKDGFPIDIYTEEEYKKNDGFKRSMPERKAQDAEAVRRYMEENEKVIDPFIEAEIKAGNFAEFEGRAQQLGWDRLYPDRIKPATYLADSLWSRIKNALAYTLNELNVDLEKATAGKNIVFIKVPDVMSYPKVTVTDPEYGTRTINVTSHSSQNAVYFFVGARLFDRLTDRDEGRLTDLVMGRGDKGDGFHNLLRDIVHEVGVAYNLPFTLRRNCVLNDLDLARNKFTANAPLPEIFEAFPSLKDPKVVNLDNNLIGRDYMAGETVAGQSMAMNPYWQTVEEDIGGFIQAGTAIGIDKDGVIWNVKTGAAIYRHPQDRGQFLKIGDMYYAEAAETIGALREKLDEIISECDKFLAGKLNNFSPHIINQKWEKAFSSIRNLDNDTNNPEARKFMSLIRSWAKTARDIDIYLVPGSLYASPRTKEIAHVRRGINQSSPGIWMGSQFIENTRRKYFNHNTYLENSAAETLAILMIDEAMHVGNSKPHGSAGSVADLDDGITHFLTPNDPIITSIIQTGEARGDLPWDPMLPGGNVGKGKAMREFFDRLTQFAASKSSEVLLIEGPSGVGKNMAVDAIREMMRTHKDDRFPDRVHTRFVRISCAEFSGMSTGEIRRDLFGEANYPGLITKALTGERQSTETSPLLIIDELPDASPELQGQLLRVLDEKKSINVPGLGELDLTDLKVICLANRNVDHLRGDLKNRISQRIAVPTLLERELADEGQTVLLAEYFNYEASKANGIPWAPFDEWMGEALGVLAQLTGYDSPGMEDARNLKHFVENIVKTRALLLKGAPALNRIPDSAAWARNIFSPYLITCADLIAVKTDFMDRRLNATLTEDYTRRIYAAEPLLPYFKEFAPRDAAGNIVGFHKGPRGEQPGLPFEGTASDVATAPEDTQETMLRDAAMLSPLALRILKVMSIKVSTGEENRPDTVAYDLFTSKEEFTAGQVYHYWWFWRMVTNFEALYSEAKDGFRDDRLFEALNELRRAGFVSAERDIRDLESKFRATDRLRDIISAFPLAINGFTAYAEDGFFRARGGTAICPNGDLEIKAPEARGGADVFEFEQNVADTVSKAILTYLTASSRNTRQDNKDILMKNKEAAYVIGMSALSSLGVTFGIKDPPLGKNAMAAYRMLIKDLRANGRITTGSAQHGEFIKLINELAVYIREPYKSFAETLKGGRVGRPTSPGKSPDDALLLIASTDLKDRDFTLKEYLAAYMKFGRRLGFSAPAAHPETTARNDLYLAKKSLEKTGLLRIVNKKAVDNKKEREYRFRLTSLGQAQGNIARLRYKAVILFFNAGFASDADEEDPVYYKRYGIGRYDSLRTTIRHKTMSISFAYINAPPSLSGKTKGRDYSFGPRSTKVTLQDTRSYEEYTYRGPFPVIDMRTDLNGRVIEYVVTKEFYDFCVSIHAASYKIKGSDGYVFGGVAMIPVDLLTGKALKKKAGPGRPKSPGKSPAAMMVLIAEYMQPDEEISAPKLRDLYLEHWQEFGFDKPAANPLSIVDYDLFSGPNSLANINMVEINGADMPNWQTGKRNEYLFGLTEAGRKAIESYRAAQHDKKTAEKDMAEIITASVAVPVSINRGHRDSSTDWYMALQTIVFDRSLQGKPFTVDQLIAASVVAGDCFGFGCFDDNDARRYIEFLVAKGYLQRTGNIDEYELTPGKGKEQVDDLSVELAPYIAEYRALKDSLEDDSSYNEAKYGIPQGVYEQLVSIAEEYGIEPTDENIAILHSIWKAKTGLDKAIEHLKSMGLADAGMIAAAYRSISSLTLNMAGAGKKKDRSKDTVSSQARTIYENVVAFREAMKELEKMPAVKKAAKESGISDIFYLLGIAIRADKIPQIKEVLARYGFDVNKKDIKDFLVKYLEKQQDQIQKDALNITTAPPGVREKYNSVVAHLKSHKQDLNARRAPYTIGSDAMLAKAARRLVDDKLKSMAYDGFPYEGIAEDIARISQTSEALSFLSRLRGILEKRRAGHDDMEYMIDLSDLLVLYLKRSEVERFAAEMRSYEFSPEYQAKVQNLQRVYSDQSLGAQSRMVMARSLDEFFKSEQEFNNYGRLYGVFKIYLRTIQRLAGRYNMEVRTRRIDSSFVTLDKALRKGDAGEISAARKALVMDFVRLLYPIASFGDSSPHGMVKEMIRKYITNFNPVALDEKEIWGLYSAVDEVLKALMDGQELTDIGIPDVEEKPEPAKDIAAGISPALKLQIRQFVWTFHVNPTDTDIAVLDAIRKGKIGKKEAVSKLKAMGVSDIGSAEAMYSALRTLVLGMAGAGKGDGDKKRLSPEESGSPADILIDKFGLRTYAELKNGRGFISNTPDYVFFAGQSKEWNTGMPVLQVYDVRHGEPELIQETEHYKHGYYNDRYFAVLSYEKNHPYGYKDASILSVYDLRDNMKRVMVMRLDRKWEKVTLKSHYLMLEGEQYARLIDIESKKDVIDPEKLRSRASDCYLFSDYFVMYTPQCVDVYENATGRLVVSLRRVDTGRGIPHYMSKVTQITDTHLLFETVEEPYLGTRYGIVIRLKDGQEVVRHAYEGDDMDHKAFELTDNYLEEYTFSKGRNAVYDLRTGRRLENIEDLRTEADIERERQREESEKEKPFVTMLKNQKFSQLVSLLTRGLHNGDDEAVRRICRVINSADKDVQMAFFTSAAWIKFRGKRKGEDAPSKPGLNQSTDEYGCLKATKAERDLLISIARRHGASRLTDEDIKVLTYIWGRVYSFDDAYPKIQDMGISDRDTALNMFNEISTLVLGMAGAGEKPVVNADKTGALGNFDTIASISNKYGVEPGILKNIYFRVPSAILILPQAIEILNASMFKNYAGLWMDTYIKSVRTILDPDAPSEIRRKEIQALHVHFATLSHNAGKNLSDRDLLKELSAIVEEDEAREKRLDKALIFIARSDTLQKMMAESGGFRLSDYMAVCPDDLRPTAQSDLDLLAAKESLTRNKLGNYTAASAFNSKMLGLGNLMLEAGKNSKDEASMQAVWQLQQTINEISSNETLAKQVGLEMPTNEHKRYTLLLPKAFFKQGEDELKNDKDRFGDRFEIDMVEGNYADALLRNAVTQSRDNARASVLLIPSDFGVTAEDLAKLKGVGMSYMIVDAEALKEAQNAADRERAEFRTDTYAIMWLSRYVKDADPASSGAFNLLRFYLKTHFAFSGITVEDYIDAIVTGNIAAIIRGYLKFRPSVPRDAETDYHRVATALIFA